MIRPLHRVPFVLVVAVVWLLAVGLLAAETAGPFAPGRHGGGELKYLEGVPVLVVRGTPEQIGRQTAALLGREARQVLDYPRRAFAGGPDGEATWSRLVEASRRLWPNVPAAHRAEIETVARSTGAELDVLVAGNVVMDLYRGLGCSSLLVEPDRSKTGAVLFGRNLDFVSAGYLHQYTIVTICRPAGKHAFASVGFPGLFGCLSGMNDAGLAVAVHEVLLSRDGSRLFNPEGVPYTFAIRRVLEECTSVEAAERLMRSMARTTMYNLSICDRRRVAVLEVTPRSVVRRESTDGLCACTNDFRSEPLVILPYCNRYTKLLDVPERSLLGVADVAGKLRAVNLGRLTLQTMIFEPGPLRLHLAFGTLPASSGPLRPLDLAPLLRSD